MFSHTTQLHLIARYQISNCNVLHCEKYKITTTQENDINLLYCCATKFGVIPPSSLIQIIYIQYVLSTHMLFSLSVSCCCTRMRLLCNFVQLNLTRKCTIVPFSSAGSIITMQSHRTYIFVGQNECARNSCLTLCIGENFSFGAALRSNDQNYFSKGSVNQ